MFYSCLGEISVAVRLGVKDAAQTPRKTLMDFLCPEKPIQEASGAHPFPRNLFFAEMFVSE